MCIENQPVFVHLVVEFAAAVDRSGQVRDWLTLYDGVKASTPVIM